jgi:orotate phosphoribosyltransferase
MSKLIEPDHNLNILENLQRCDAWYKCRKNSARKRLGPLVGYAGRYDGTNQFVGDVYFNFAQVESQPRMLRFIAAKLAGRLFEMSLLESVAAFCGMPLGGLQLGTALAAACTEQRSIFLEKESLSVKTAKSREKARLVIGRHEICPGEKIILVEDVCNNFSTTSEAIELIAGAGAEIAAIACVLNRSLSVHEVYDSIVGPVPVVALLRIPIVEYRQDDPEVAEDVAAGNVVWKPKSREGWARLRAAMNAG